MREYQKDFITLYKHLRKSENKAYKQGKPNYVLQKLSLHNKQGICLDIGCSDGLIALSLNNQFHQIVGADIDLKALERIENTFSENVRFLSGDAMALPFEDQSMDAIICSQTYEHVPSSEKLFCEINRVIKDGGVVFFSGPNKTFPIEPHYLLPFLHWLNQKSADLFLRFTKKGDHYYERSETYWKLEKIFQGYEIIDVIKLVFEYYGQYSPKNMTRLLNKVASKLPSVILRILSPFMVNINWILIKKATGYNEKRRVKFVS